MTEIKVLEWDWLQKIRFVFARRLYRPGFQRRPCSDLEKKCLDGKKRSHAWYERSNLSVYLISYKKVKKVWLTKKGIFQKYFCLSLINMPQESFMIFVASINIITGDSGLCRVVLVVDQPSGSTYWKEVDRANGSTHLPLWPSIRCAHCTSAC